MDLEGQKKLAKGFGAVALAGAVVVGGIYAFSGSSKPEKPAAKPVATQPAVTAQPPVKATPISSVEADMKQTLKSLARTDAELMKAKGVYNGGAEVHYKAFGSACKDDGNIKDSKYSNDSSSLSYDVTVPAKNSQREICINHKGGKVDGIIASPWHKKR